MRHLSNLTEIYPMPAKNIGPYGRIHSPMVNDTSSPTSKKIVDDLNSDIMDCLTKSKEQLVHDS